MKSWTKLWFSIKFLIPNFVLLFLLVKWVPGQGPEQRESEKAALYLHIIIILISHIIFKLLINENHPS